MVMEMSASCVVPLLKPKPQLDRESYCWRSVWAREQAKSWCWLVIRQLSTMCLFQPDWCPGLWSFGCRCRLSQTWWWLLCQGWSCLSSPKDSCFGSTRCKGTGIGSTLDSRVSADTSPPFSSVCPSCSGRNTWERSGQRDFSALHLLHRWKPQRKNYDWTPSSTRCPCKPLRQSRWWR